MRWKSRWASKTFSIEQPDPRIPLKKSTFREGVRIGLLDGKSWDRKGTFFDCMHARFSLRSEVALFDPPIRLHKNWPYGWPKNGEGTLHTIHSGTTAATPAGPALLVVLVIGSE